MSFTNWLHCSGVDKKDTKKIICDLRDYVDNRILDEIWIPRCNRLHEMERMMGITKMMKQTKNNEVSFDNFNSSFSSSFYNNINIDDLYFGLRQKIYYGGNILGFMSIVNHVL